MRPLPELLIVLGILSASAIGPWAVAGEDCNGNGIPDATDIAEGTSQDCNGNDVPDECDTAVEFVEHVISVEADGAQSVYTADLDGDGDTDVLSSSFFDGKIAWYPNADGAGTFGPQRIVSTDTVFPRTVFAIDIDGDGDSNVLSASGTDDKIAWYENTTGSGVFGPQQIISSDADGAWTVFAIDIDGDGDTNVLSASLNDNKIAWYENTDGAGSFSSERIISTEADFALSVFAMDVDDDGDADVLSASASDNKIAWYENTSGTGIFGPQQVITLEAENASSVYGADLDGDGDRDVLSASATDGKIAWYEKLDGLDEFGPQQIISASSPFARQVYAADLDGDGDRETLSAAELDDKIAWYENTDGAGSFGPEQIVSIQADDARGVHADDVDGDGDIDVLSASAVDDKVAWYENKSDDCNGNAVPDECEPDCDGNGIADACDLGAGRSVDCNGNGIPDECDINVGTSQDCTSNGIPDECEPDCNANSTADSCDINVGTSQDCTSNGVPDECEPDCNTNDTADSCDINVGTSQDCTSNGIPDECEPDCNTNSTADSCDIDTGASDDCDGNAVPDECDAAGAGDDCNGNDLLDACETAIVFTPHLVSTDADFPRSLAAADLDGDGDADLLSASFSDDKIAWYENTDGAGTFGPQQIISTAADGALGVFAADVDNDGDIDALSASAFDDKIAWYENTDGAGTFGPQRIVSSVAGQPVYVHAADLDGDGNVDALSANFASDEIAWYENVDGAGGFGPLRAIATTAAGAFMVSTADVDGDGDPDVLSGSFDDGKIAWHRNTGSATFWPEKIITFGSGESTNVFGIDVDGDGDVDVMTASQKDDAVAWHENTDGAGTFGPRQVINTSANGITSIAPADVDGDGDADVVSASFFDSKVAWYENSDSAGAFGPQQIISTVGDGVFAVITADLDGDGDTDVVRASQNDDTITWYENESDDCNGNGIPDDCDIVSLASDDCNGNGLPDECEADCNANGVADSCDIAALDSDDCDANGVPDECEPDCNGNGQMDRCDVAAGAEDCNANSVPDECEPDCNADGVPDTCDPDCNENGIPDGCETDCNENQVADECDLSGGTSLDCNTNGVPDECDAGCSTCDSDGDLCLDEVDSDPDNSQACADTDADTCDDCAAGSFDPSHDGLDTDFDGICNPGDCAALNGTVWLEPGPVTTLAASQDDGTTTLIWLPPAELGAVVARYDTLRSPLAADFTTPAICLETDGTDTSSEDLEVPAVGSPFYYLVRVENDCPDGIGSMGSNSDGVPRTGLACP